MARFPQEWMQWLRLYDRSVVFFHDFSDVYFLLGAVLHPVLDLGHSRHQRHWSREGDGRRHVHVLA